LEEWLAREALPELSRDVAAQILNTDALLPAFASLLDDVLVRGVLSLLRFSTLWLCVGQAHELPLIVRTAARELALDHVVGVRAGDQLDILVQDALYPLLLQLAQECIDEELQDAVFNQVRFVGASSRPSPPTNPSPAF
jgi:hypothetical protein